MDATTDISPLIRLWLPDTSVEEQVIATQELRRYIAAVYRIYTRLEAEGAFPLARDKTDTNDKLELFTDHEV